VVEGTPVEHGSYSNGVYFVNPTCNIPSNYMGLSTIIINDSNDVQLENWSPDTLIGGRTGPHRPVALTDSQDNILVVWTDLNDQQAYQQYYTKILKNETIIINEIELPTVEGGYLESPQSVTIDSLDNIHMVYRDGNGEVIYYTKMDNNGNVLIPNKQIITRSGPSLSYPSLVIGSDGNIRVAIREFTGGTAFVMLDNNGTVLKTIRGIGISKSGYWTGEPGIILDQNNTAYLAWFDSYDVSIHLGKIASNGIIITENQKLFGVNRWEAIPQLSFDKEGNINIIWQDDDINSTGQIFSTKINSTGNVLMGKISITNNPPGTSFISDFSVYTDQFGDFYFIWSSNSSLHFSHTNGTDFQPIITSTRITAFGGYYPSITVQAESKEVHVIWLDSRYGTMKIYKKYTPYRQEISSSTIITDTSATQITSSESSSRTSTPPPTIPRITSSLSLLFLIGVIFLLIRLRRGLELRKGEKQVYFRRFFLKISKRDSYS
ncbi:MAG: hypothetical protein ACFFAE_04940, partial [Candidatus Hodarchaeota archaeon]